MRISDWSSDVCSSDLRERLSPRRRSGLRPRRLLIRGLWIRDGGPPAVAAVEKSPRHNASPLETAAMPIEAALIKPVVDVLMGLFRQGENLRLKSNAEAALREAIRELLLASHAIGQAACPERV